MVVIPTGYGSFNAWPSLRCDVITAVGEFAVAWPTLTPIAGSQPVEDGTVTFAGQLMVKRWFGRTVMRWVQVAWRPDGSVTTRVISVAPIGYAAVKASPSSRLSLNSNGWSPVKVAVPTLDELPFGSGTKAEDWPSLAVTVMLAGQLIVGASESTTVMVKLHKPSPVEDVAVTVVVPIGKKDPEAGVVVTVPQLPTASGAEKVTLAPPPEPWVVAVVTMSFGQSRLQSGALPPFPTTSKVTDVLSSLCVSSVVLVTVAVLETVVPAAASTV
jgi:hypothetical protein